MLLRDRDSRQVRLHIQHNYSSQIYGYFAKIPFHLVHTRPRGKYPDNIVTRQPRNHQTFITLSQKSIFTAWQQQPEESILSTRNKGRLSVGIGIVHVACQGNAGQREHFLPSGVKGAGHI